MEREDYSSETAEIDAAKRASSKGMAMTIDLQQHDNPPSHLSNSSASSRPSSSMSLSSAADPQLAPRQKKFVHHKGDSRSEGKATLASTRAETQPSLQAAFQAFRQRRKRELQEKRQRQAAIVQQPKAEAAPRTPEMKAALRKKFLEKALSYKGVPYHRRYHQDPSSPHYNAPLYLDCCGLVRQVLRDLREDFGFDIGPWNQAYQFDTLPIEVKKEDMKPGDLVFISGTYFDKKKRPQKHDMVHVEIWMGDGEKTLGARRQHGVVEVHDSYAFVSKNYGDMVYLFRSIDTWLDGVCKSFCKEHPWLPKQRLAGSSKFSVFFEDDQDADVSDNGQDEQQQDQVDVAASDTGGEDTRDPSKRKEQGYVTSRNSCKPSEDGASDGKHWDEPDDSDDEGGSDNSRPRPFESRSAATENIEGSKNETSQRDTSGGRKSCGGTKQARHSADISSRSQKHAGVCSYVGEVSCWTKQGPPAYSSAAGSESLSWLLSSWLPSIHVAGRELFLRLVTFPLLEDASSSSSSPGRRRERAAASSPRSGSNQSRLFFVGGNNGVSLICEPLERRGWQRLDDKADQRYTLRWVERTSDINFASFKPGKQLVCRNPKISVIANKSKLLDTLRRYHASSSKARKRVLDYHSFFPATYKLSNAQEADAFCRLAKKAPEQVWICKPTAWNQGKGIFLVTDVEGFIAEVQEQQRKMRAGKKVTPQIVQYYISNPLLINRRKFDIRAYMYIASCHPSIVFYHPGYLRLSVAEYSDDFTQTAAHLTNQYVQKKEETYKTMQDDTVWSFSQLQDYLDTHSDVVKADLPTRWVTNVLEPRIKELMRHVFLACKPDLDTRFGFFDLLGFDFMVDDRLNVWLIEVNVNPALHTSCSYLKELIPPIVQEVIDIEIELLEKHQKRMPLTPLDAVRNFQPIL